MSLSIESIRELNKMHLLAVNIPQKASAKTKWAASGEYPWKVSLYAGSSLALGGAIQITDPLSSILNSVTQNKWVAGALNIAQGGWGIAPQLDIAQKYLYSGVDPLTFQVTGLLVLQNDLEEDFLTPLEQLSYLTFPDRGSVLAVGKSIEDLQNGLKKLVGDKLGFLTNLTNNLGALYNTLTGNEGSPDAQGWKAFQDSFNEWIGQVYTMKVPPTFDFKKAGSGLDFRYGGVLISDVFIKSMRVEVPTLYYEGGYPPVLQVTLDLATFRPLTATAFNKIMRTEAQSWTSDGVGVARKYEKQREEDRKRWMDPSLNLKKL